jgi:thymidylate synthase
MLTANNVWFENVKFVHRHGETCSPRGKQIRELLCHRSIVDMNYPCVTVNAREMGFRFLMAEAAWILSGDNRVSTISPYAKAISKFSDNGYVFQGAYGPRVTEQLRYVTETLMGDMFSRQAVINIWRENPRDSRDIPCTLSLQFLIREDKLNRLRLHVIATMRSSDLWLGWVYDVFNFSMIAAWVALRLREMSEGAKVLELGNLYLTAGSQHIYSTNDDGIWKCLNTGGDAWHYRPLDLSTFNDPNDLMSHIVALRDRNWLAVGTRFFSELQDHVS